MVARFLVYASFLIGALWSSVAAAQYTGLRLRLTGTGQVEQAVQDTGRAAVRDIDLAAGRAVRKMQDEVPLIMVGGPVMMVERVGAAAAAEVLESKIATTALRAAASAFSNKTCCGGNAQVVVEEALHVATRATGFTITCRSCGRTATGVALAHEDRVVGIGASTAGEAIQATKGIRLGGGRREVLGWWQQVTGRPLVPPTPTVGQFLAEHAEEGVLRGGSTNMNASTVNVLSGNGLRLLGGE